MSLLTLILLTSAFSLTSSTEGNSSPCMRAKHNNAHSVFLKRHVPDGVPKTWDQNAWEALLRNIKTCNRPTQSFFHALDRDRVNGVCTASGGKALDGNLCISKEKFSFVTVRIDVGEGTCGIKRMVNESKHIILACDQIRDACQPVHFEANPKSLEPEMNQRDCELSSRKSGGFRAAAQQGILVLTLIVMVYFL